MFHHHCSHGMTSLGHAVEPISDTAPFSLKSIDPHVFHHISGCIISDLSLYPTDLSTFLLICSCWLLMSAIAWLNRVWPCVIWAVICMITCGMLGPFACPAAGAGGVLGCCGCCCWAILVVLQVSWNSVQKSLWVVLEILFKVMQIPLDFPDFQERESQPPELNQLGINNCTVTAGYQNLMNGIFGLVNLMNTPWARAQFSAFSLVELEGN